MTNGTILPKRSLGNTGLELSALGLGTVKFGRNQGVKYPQDFDLPDMDHLQNLLSLASELGVNYLDTGAAYELSEERLGTLLYGQRQEWIIGTKAGEEFENGISEYNFTPSHFEKSLERSLKRLKTDYIDILFVHCDQNEVDTLKNNDLIETLHKFKERGLVRTLGASTRTVEGGILSLQHLDTAMVMYNPAYTDEEPVLDYARENGKSVLLKKVLNSGHLNKVKSETPLQDTMDFVFSHPAVTSAVIGTITPKNLKANVEAICQSTSIIKP